MSNQRIQARDMRSALRQAKERFGEQVNILANRPIPNGIELLVSVGPAATPAPSATADFGIGSQERFAQRARQTGRDLAAQFGIDLDAPATAPVLPRTPERRTTARQPAVADNAEINELRTQLAELKTMITAVAQPAAIPAEVAPNISTRSPRVATVDALEGIGFTRQAISKLTLTQSHKDPVRDGLNAVAKSLTVVKSPGLHDSTQVFVGAAGAGKTTTIAKLAAQKVMQGGANSVAIISLDSRRMGAGMIASSLARVLGIQVVTVSPDESLLEARQKISAPQVLVDTAGLTPADPGFRRQQEQVAQLRDATLWLVSSATQQISAARSVYRAQGKLSLSGMILTKLDEACNLGEALSLTLESGLPVAWSTDGQRIPDDIQEGKASSLFHQALLLARQSTHAFESKAV